MTDRPRPGTYVHYKNAKHYTVIDVVRHSETEEWMVLYRAEYGDYGLLGETLKKLPCAGESRWPIRPSLQVFGLEALLPAWATALSSALSL